MGGRQTKLFEYLTAQEQLSDLYEKGWKDEKIGIWINKRLLKSLPERKGDSPFLAPATNSIYRWRKGKAKPTSLYVELIGTLYEEVCSEDKTD